MISYIIRRLLWGVVLLVLVLALLFVMFRVLPTADPAKLRAGRLQSPKIIAEIRHDLGLDKSLPAQFWLYIKNLFLHFDLGYSYYSNAPVKELIFNRLPATLSLVIGGADPVGGHAGSASASSQRDARARAWIAFRWAPRSCSCRPLNTGSA